MGLLVLWCLSEVGGSLIQDVSADGRQVATHRGSGVGVTEYLLDVSRDPSRPCPPSARAGARRPGRYLLEGPRLGGRSGHDKLAAAQRRAGQRAKLSAL